MLRLSLILLLPVFLLFGCEQQSGDALLKQIQAQGQLRILTLNSPTTYYQSKDQGSGPEYDMLTAFAGYLGVEAEFVVMDNITALFNALEQGKGDIAAAGLTRTGERVQRFLASPPYQHIQQQVVCRRNGKMPDNISEMVDLKFVVVAESSYVEQLRRLKVQTPQLNWRENANATSESLLEDVWNRKIDCTVADSNIVAINRRYYPEIEVAFDLTEPEALVWYTPLKGNDLQEAVFQWQTEYRRSGELDEVQERYYGFAEIFDYVDTKKFLKRIEARLPKYRAWFEDAAVQHDLSWTLLAAQSYQESHWNPRAKSPTGVRGIMMLTLTTAREIGVKSRLDAKSNIYGGAKYLARLKKRIPERITEPDRTWMALAAYNVGMGHLSDARKLTEKQGGNPDAWADVKETLPLLSKKKFYKQTKYGYARGSEPVAYVNHIREFELILKQYLEEKAQAESSDSPK